MGNKMEIKIEKICNDWKELEWFVREAVKLSDEIKENRLDVVINIEAKQVK